MRLLIDIGNSRLKWARHRPPGSVEAMKCVGYTQVDLAEIVADMAQSLEEPPERVIVSNVAGEAVAEAVRSAAGTHWKCPMEFAQALSEGAGVRSAYDDPGRLGTDRWLSLTAARRRCNVACCVVDAGTAVTIDTLNGAGAHLGGLILPGLTMMRKALARGTQGIGRIGRVESGEVSLLARNTGDAVTAGTLYTLVSALDRISHDLEHELGPRMKRIITGGDAETLLPLLAGEWEHVPDLVLQGLALIDGD